MQNKIEKIVLFNIHDDVINMLQQYIALFFEDYPIQVVRNIDNLPKWIETPNHLLLTGTQEIRGLDYYGYLLMLIEQTRTNGLPVLVYPENLDDPLCQYLQLQEVRLTNGRKVATKNGPLKIVDPFEVSDFRRALEELLLAAEKSPEDA
jgi:hypothetical protein